MVTKPPRPAEALDSSSAPLGFAQVEGQDGSIAPRCPSWVRKRLESNHVQLVVMRHGQSQANADSETLGQPLLYGQSESPLTDKGRAQARACGQELYRQFGGDEWLKRCAENPARLPVFASSPVSRAMESSQIMVAFFRERCQALGLPQLAEQLCVESDARLKETNFGRFETRPLPELQSAYPDFVSHWRPSQGLGTDFLHKFPGGESRADVMMRMTKFLDGLSQRHPGRTVVMMSHGESILATRAVLGQLPVDEGKLRAETGTIGNATPYWLVGGPTPAGQCKQSCPHYDL